MRDTYTAVKAAIVMVCGILSAKLGALFPVLMLLITVMVVDYLTGMLASKKEAIEHPTDPSYGWNSKKGALGIFKKVGYMAAITVAMVADYLTNAIGGQLGFDMPIKGIFALLVAVWYLLNELLSISENAGRMGAPVPDWLSRYIAVLKDKIEDTGKKDSG